jgi:glucose-1-phosphate cytidylyltransferase
VISTGDPGAGEAIPTAILCGGRGIRMGTGEVTVPKTLVEIGGRPILWHVMSIYASHGMTRFVLLLGHDGEKIEEFAAGLPPDWDVTCLQTGLETPTGGRVARAAELLGGGSFCLTYGDGVANIDLLELLSFHRSHGAAATMTVVQPRNQWGVAHLGEGDRITGFTEKPKLETWINGGFLVMEPRALDVIGPDSVLEREPLETLAGRGELFAYRHTGFWECMDTYKDTLQLNQLWDSGRAPWRELVSV